MGRRTRPFEQMDCSFESWTLKAEQIIEEASAAKGDGELFVFVVALFFPEFSAVLVDFVRPEQVFVLLYFF